jgi:hypothetical protein
MKKLLALALTGILCASIVFVALTIGGKQQTDIIKVTPTPTPSVTASAPIVGDFGESTGGTGSTADINPTISPTPTNPMPYTEDSFTITDMEDEEITSINWGSISVGLNTTVPIKVRNNLFEPISLTLNSSGHVPSNIQDFLSLSWDNTGQIQANSTKNVNVTLQCLSNPENGTNTIFSFNLVVTMS